MIRKVVAIMSLVVSVGMLGLAGWLLLGRDVARSPGACEPAEPDELEVEIVATYPHDPEAFTQGLLVDSEGELWEGTGLRGESELRRTDVVTGEVIEAAALPDDLFGEGLTESDNGELVQLTWTEGRALRWDPDELTTVGEFDYEGEGWGITTLDDSFYAMSNGSSELSFRSPEDFSEVGTMEVARKGGPVEGLNELEWDGEHLWANRYLSDEILRIDLDCGVVDGVVDASDLVVLARTAIDDAGLERDVENRDVLNGIAWLGADQSDSGGRYYLTGKRWPLLFEVDFLER